MTIAGLIVDAAMIWLAIGALVALVFLGYGVDRVLEDARGVYLFRVLVAPGVILLWPLVLWRWRLRENDAVEWQTNHAPRRRLAGFLEISMAIALIVVLGIATFIGAPPAEWLEPVKVGWSGPGPEGLA